MKITCLQSLTNHKYTQLLLTLLLLFVAYAVVGAMAAEVILSLILLIAIVLIVRTFFSKKSILLLHCDCWVSLHFRLFLHPFYSIELSQINSRFDRR